MGRRRPEAPGAVSLEARLWREVSRHLELEESLRRVAALLGEHQPVESLVVHRCEWEPARLATVAVRSEDARGVPGADGAWPARTQLSERAGRALRRFVAARRPGLLAELTPAVAGALLPSASEDGLARSAAAPLGPDAVAVLRVTGPGRAGPRELELLDLASGPLTAAAENDQRLHELARRGEALAADREALLTRLQRQDISDVVIGATGGLRTVMERVEQVAPTDAPVLILGETGSGKEVIARAIHARSSRSHGPVVRVNCGAIPPELIDSELFGHERGAFTGATATRPGWFERADGGTLFLDELGELPLAAQVRLLRVLQDGTLERVGGYRTIRVDVRLVTATHQHLESMVAAGRFREDLWYRMSVFPIRLPALRERVEDLPALVAHFAAGAGRRLGGAALVPSPSDLERLKAYDWPGNVRELAAVIERAAILGNGKRLEVAAALGAGPGAALRPLEAAPAEEVAPAAGETASRAGAPRDGAEDEARLLSLDEAMAAHIRRALELTRGRIEGPSGAARLLRINPHTLRARMRKLALDWSVYRGPVG